MKKLKIFPIVLFGLILLNGSTAYTQQDSTKVIRKANELLIELTQRREIDSLNSIKIRNLDEIINQQDTIINGKNLIIENLNQIVKKVKPAFWDKAWIGSLLTLLILKFLGLL